MGRAEGVKEYTGLINPFYVFLRNATFRLLVSWNFNYHSSLLYLTIVFIS